jgi:hypothetical protein
MVAVRGLRDTAAEVIAGRERPVLSEDHLDVIEPRRCALDELRARERGAAAPVRRFCKTEIDRIVLPIVAIEHHIVQAALTAREDLRHAGERRRELAVLADDAHATSLFGDHEAAVGKESQRPGIGKPGRNGLDHEVAGRGRIGLRRCRCGRRRHAGSGAYNEPIHEILHGIRP